MNRVFTLAVIATVFAAHALAGVYAPPECRVLEGQVGGLLRVERERGGALQSIYDLILPFGRPQSGIAALDSAHIALTTELYETIQRQQRLIHALEDHQHQLRLCGRG